MRQDRQPAGFMDRGDRDLRRGHMFGNAARAAPRKRKHHLNGRLKLRQKSVHHQILRRFFVVKISTLRPDKVVDIDRLATGRLKFGIHFFHDLRHYRFPMTIYLSQKIIKLDVIERHAVAQHMDRAGMKAGGYLNAANDLDPMRFSRRDRFGEPVQIIMVGDAQNRDIVFRRHFNKRRRRVMAVGKCRMAMQINQRHIILSSDPCRR